MTSQRWLMAVAVAAGCVFAGSGCVTCCHKSAEVTLHAGPTSETPLVDRQHVYAVLINGLTPGGPSGLEGLRDRLAERGFGKVYYGQLCHAWWLEREMRRVHACDPAARFVVVGCDVAGAAATAVATDGLAHGLAVDAVILLDPAGVSSSGGCPTRTLLVRSCASGRATPHTESLAVAGASRVTLPAHPETVAAVCGVLADSAARVEHPPFYDVEPSYEFAPPSRQLAPPGEPLPPEWLFLHDLPGTHTVPLSPIPRQEWLPAPIAPSLLPRGGFAPPENLPRARPLPLFVPNAVPVPPVPLLPTPRPLDGTP